MESGDRASEEVTDESQTTSRLGLRSAAASLILVGIAFVQNPGLLVADTKFDLAVAPMHFLSRALHLWDPEAAFGQLQNQAYGYLWPMGPFFVLGSFLQLDGWVVQRLWMALVMIVAFIGTAKVARALGARSDLACLVAGFAYALSPRMLSTLGPISIEAWPSALAPWVLLPLIRGSREGSPRRMALLSAVAVAMVGGVNAAATFAVLPLGILWLLTRSAGPRKRSLLLWWPLFTAMGTLWWLVPLFLMGAYSPPFLDFIETSSVTTFPTNPFDALRGTSDWVPYLDTTWQGGFEVLTTGYLALNSGILLMLGLVGVMQRSNPHRQFLVIALVAGLLMVSMGHQGQVEGWFAHATSGQLDAALSPLRNVHKFDPLIRLPMVLGLAWLVETALASLRASGRSLLPGPAITPVAVIALALIALLGSALPAVSGRLTTTRPVFDTPGYWQETAAWLDRQKGDDIALLAPGSGFGSYLWGEPRDEPQQWLAESRWGVRNAIPLAPPGNIRMLDGFEARLAQGRPSSGLAPYLRRAGVRFLVVRNDLRPSSDVPEPVLVHQALGASPDIEHVRSFGPEVGGAAYLNDGEATLVVNDGWQSRWPAVEIYEVQGASSAVTAQRLPVVVGGPEDLLDLADAGVLEEEPTQLAADTPEDRRPGGPVILTDGPPDRERFFGRVHDGYSAVITPGDRRRSGNPVADYPLAGGDRWLTTSRLTGAASISASSSASDSNAGGGARPGEQPLAAVDDDPATSWVSGGGAHGGGAWWQVDLETPESISEVDVTLAEDGGRTRVRVVTEAGTSEQLTLEPGTAATVPVPPGQTSWIRVEDASGGRRPISLAEVVWGGREVSRQLVLPELPSSWGKPSQVHLRALRDYRTGCAAVDGDVRCGEERFHPSEERTGFDRVVTLPSEAAFDASVTAVPRVGLDLLVRLQQGLPVNITGSSTAVPDVRASALAAIDGDRGTTWTATQTDTRPQLNLNWIGKRTLRTIRIATDRSAPARRPTVVRLTWPGGSRTVALDKKGRGRYRPIRTDSLAVRVTDAARASSVGRDGERSRLPVGIGELRLPQLGLVPAPPSRSAHVWNCGSGPTVVVNGVPVKTRLRASVADLTTMRPVPADLCGTGPVRMTSGENIVQVRASRMAEPVAVRLGSSVGSFPVPAAGVEFDGPVTRRIHPEPGGSVVALRENTNAGWEATQNGRTLEPLVVDGWQQAWRTDGSSAQIGARYLPDRAYRGGLLVGGLLFLLLFALVALPKRWWGRGDLPPVAPARVPAVAMYTLGLAASGLLAGWAGVALFVGMAAVGAVRSWRDHAAFPWLTAGLLMASSTAYFVRPWGSSEGWAGTVAWPSYLVVAAVSASVVVVADRPGRFRNRMAGSSTNR